MLSLDVDGGAR